MSLPQNENRLAIAEGRGIGGMQRAVIFLSNLLTLCASLALVLMMAGVTIDVFGKYFLAMPLPGTAEIVASYNMVGIVFLSLACIEVHNRQIVVELFYDRMPGRLRRFCNLLGGLATLAFYGLLGYQSWEIALQAMEIGEVVEGAWAIVIWPSRFLIPIGLFVACLVVLIRLWATVSGGLRFSDLSRTH